MATDESSVEMLQGPDLSAVITSVIDPFLAKKATWRPFFLCLAYGEIGFLKGWIAIRVQVVKDGATGGTQHHFYVYELDWERVAGPSPYFRFGDGRLLMVTDNDKVNPPSFDNAYWQRKAVFENVKATIFWLRQHVGRNLINIHSIVRESDFYIEKDLWDWSPDEDDNDPETEKFLWREIITDALHMLAHRVA